MGLVEKIQSVNGSVLNKMWDEIEFAIDLYNRAYESHPNITKFISTAIGTVGGDAIAKRFVYGENIGLRDVAFTSTAAVYQSWLYPKLLPLADNVINNKNIESAFRKVKINKSWAKAIILTGLFFPLNILYWNVLSVKNRTPRTLDNLIAGTKTIAEASIPYIGIDYIVANKLKRKYALPVWSGAELAWNTYVALKNYMTKYLF